MGSRLIDASFRALQTSPQCAKARPPKFDSHLTSAQSFKTTPAHEPTILS
jgi:hypothetical protein